MKREILVNATPRETRVAILEDGLLVELLVDRPDARRMVGDVYLGKVEAVLPGIQAAFVNIGTEKSAFLHAADVVVDDAAVNADDEDDEEGWYEHDLVGLTVVDPTGVVLGEVSGLVTGPAQDLLEVRLSGGGEALVPFVEAIVPEVAPDAGRVVVDAPPGLLDLDAAE